MPRTVFEYKEVDTTSVSGSQLLATGSTIKLEVFRFGTYATGAKTASTALDVAERGGLSNGDVIYVGTNKDADDLYEISIATVTGTGPGEVTLAKPISWSNNDSVVRKSDGATDPDYAEVYDSPDYDNAVMTNGSGSALTLDSTTNQYEAFLKANIYAVRYSDGSTPSNTLKLQHAFRLNTTDTLHANEFATAGQGTAADPWTGWETVGQLSSDIHFPAGVYTTDGWVPTLAGNAESQPWAQAGNMHIWGDGPGLTKMYATADAICVNINSSNANELTNIIIEGFSVSQLTANTTFLMQVAECNRAVIRDIDIDSNGASVVSGIHLDVDNSHISDIRVVATDASRFSSTGITMAGSNNTITNPYVAHADRAIYLTSSDNTIVNPLILNDTTAASSQGIEMTSLANNTVIINPRISNFQEGVDFAASDGNAIISGRISGAEAGGDGACVVIDGGTENVIFYTELDSGYDGIEITTASSACVYHRGTTGSFTNALIVDVGATTDARLDVYWAGIQYGEIRTLPDNATPTVAGARKFLLTGTTTPITNFDNGVIGQEILILSEQTGIVIEDGTNILCPTGGDLTLNDTDSVSFILKADSKWYCTGHSDNS